MVPLSDALKEQIRRQFAAERDRSQAEDLLLQYGSSTSHQEVERIRRDLLELCGSNLEKLCYDVEQAKLDHRDIILFAEYDEDERGNPVLKAKFRNTHLTEHRQLSDEMERRLHSVHDLYRSG